MKNNQWKQEFFQLYTSNLKESIESAIKLKNNNIPTKLYRYRNFDDENKKYRYQEICEGKLFLNPPKKLNDPFDSGTLLSSNIPIDYIPNKEDYVNGFRNILSDIDIQQVLESDNWFDVLMSKINSYYADIQEDAAKEFKNIPLYCAQNANQFTRYFIQDYVKIACFTETSTNLPMWTLYAKEHTGICLEYDVKQFEDIDKLLPVFYCDILPDGAKIVINNQFGQYLNLSLASIQKHNDWRYENEWRLIYKTSDWYKEPKDAPKTFIESGKTIDFIKPSRVLLGKNISPENEQEIREWCSPYTIDVRKMICTEYGLKPI